MRQHLQHISMVAALPKSLLLVGYPLGCIAVSPLLYCAVDNVLYRYMRGVMLGWMESLAGPSGAVPDAWGTTFGVGMTLYAALTAPIHLLVSMHVLTIVGRSNLQPPKPRPEEELNHSVLLNFMGAAPTLMQESSVIPAHARPDLAKLMPPNADDPQHLNEWLEAADYATSALVMMAGVWGLDDGCVPPPKGRCIASPVLLLPACW
jgi:hypothetical protein